MSVICQGPVAQADAMTGGSKSPGSSFESGTAKALIFKAYFYLFLFFVRNNTTEISVLFFLAGKTFNLETIFHIPFSLLFRLSIRK